VGSGTRRCIEKPQMDELIRKIEAEVRDEFAGAQTELDTIDPERVSGYVIWDGFGGLSQLERQSLLWQALRRELSPDAQMGISAILTLTPREKARIDANAEPQLA